MSGMREVYRLGYVALLAEGVDRNMGLYFGVPFFKSSPSSRRAWIEIRQSP